MSETLKTKKAEQTFSTALLIVLLLILPIWGGLAMLVGSVIGLVAYAVLFRERLRSRGWLRFIVISAVAALLGAAIAVTLSRGP